MGCHTWYRIPKFIGKEAVKKAIIDSIDSDRLKDWWNEECELEALTTFKILEDDDPEDWYDVDILGYSFNIVNDIPGLYVEYPGDSDEPRIGGYPDRIITSAKEMFEFMRTGFIDDKGRHHKCRIDEGREEIVKNLINTFFNLHPDGIIEFG